LIFTEERVETSPTKINDFLHDLFPRPLHPDPGSPLPQNRANQTTLSHCDEVPTSCPPDSIPLLKSGA
jgi:hypothetical protein